MDRDYGITLHIISSNLSYQFGRTIRTTEVDFMTNQGWTIMTRRKTIRYHFANQP